MQVNQNFLNKLNKLIKTAIYHGGDYGGPYFTEFENLTKSLVDLTKSLNTEEKQIKVVWTKQKHFPRLKFKD